ncbi:hypothetical protein DdX_13445 [Ditylenchus destructor]|uniref:GW182 middle domain-containing protein n=1 Tax=Ditylenchus destructor TaxID=166010 RepID=A0AAD4MYS3_9BILA|nr:hypothetical protein DdX_13445 [Ditylenchus destructor]
MWGENTGATAEVETVSINPYVTAGLSQQQQHLWQTSMPGARGSSNTPTANASSGNKQQTATGTTGSQGTVRSWDSAQQQLPSQNWTPAQMNWTPVPQPGGAWHMAQQPQWTPPSNSPGTYADQAKKNMPLNRTGQTTTAGGSTGGPSSLASANTGTGYQPQQQQGSGNWGAGSIKVDQQTPWDTAAGHHQQQNQGDWNTGNGGSGSRWGQQPPGASLPQSGTGGWQQPAATNLNGPPPGSDWSVTHNTALPNQRIPQQPSQHQDITGTSHWNAAPATGPPPVPTSLMMVQPGAAPIPLNSTTTAQNANWTTGGPPNGADSVAPQATDLNNDMMWHDPNPKQKKVQRDTGTQVWGDPCGQREIKRWKEADEPDESASSQIAELNSNPSGTDWSTLPLHVQPPPGQVNISEQPSGEMPAWGDAMPANADLGTGGWGSSSDTPTGANPVSASSGWSVPTSSPQNATNGSEMHYRLNSQRLYGSSANPSSDRMPRDTSSHLTSHIEQIQSAMNRGLINMATLTSSSIMANPQILMELTKHIQRIFGQEHELAKLHQQSHSNGGIYKNEEERLICEINNSKAELAELQRSICSGSIAIPGQNNTTSSTQNGSLSSSTDGQSRLQQWKKSNNSSDSDKTSAEPNSIAAGVQSLITSTQNMALQGDINGLGNDWKTGELDWSPPISSSMGVNQNSMGFAPKKNEQMGLMSSASPLEMTNTMSNAGNHFLTDPSSHHFDNESGDYVHDHNSTGLMDDGPQAFIPGKKWEWRDPNKVAEDPDATPGTCKPNPLLSSAMQQHYTIGNKSQHSQSGTMPTGMGTPTEQQARGFNAWSSLPQSFPPTNAAADVWNPKHRNVMPPTLAGPHPAGLMTNPPARMMGPPPPQINSILGGFPPGTGYPPGLPHSSGSVGNRAQFAPAAPMPFGTTGYWILFQMVNINDQQIQMVCGRVGRLINFMIVGHKIACAKFADPNIDALLQRLKVEFQFAPQNIKVVPDEEFDKMMRASRASNMPVTNVWSAAPPIAPPALHAPLAEPHWSATPDMMMGPPPMQHFGAPMEEPGRPF